MDQQPQHDERRMQANRFRIMLHERGLHNLAVLCQNLKANNPDETEVDTFNLPATDDEVAAQLGEALQDNAVVTHLKLAMDSMTVDGVRRGITHFVSNSQSLRQIEIFPSRTARNEDRDRVLDVVNQLLVAVADSPGRIEHLRLPSSPVTRNFGIPQFLTAMDGLRTSLKLLDLSFSWDMNNDTADVVANSLCILTCLEDLKVFDYTPDCRFAIATINRLVDHTSLQKLSVRFFSELADKESCSGAVRNLLLSSTPLVTLVLHYHRMENHSFSTVLSSLHSAGNHNNNTTLRELDLSGFEDGEGQRTSDEDAEDIANMLRNNQTIQVLKLDCIQGAQQVATIMEALAGSNRTLQELHVTDYYQYYRYGNGEPMTSEFDRITGIFPRLTHLRTFEWGFMEGYPDYELPCIARLAGGFEQNFSLTSVNVGFLSDDQRGLIHNYTQRNDQLLQLQYHRFKEAASKENATATRMLLTVFPQVQASNLDEALVLSVFLETFRERDDWNPSSFSVRSPPVTCTRAFVSATVQSIRHGWELFSNCFRQK